MCTYTVYIYIYIYIISDKSYIVIQTVYVSTLICPTKMTVNLRINSADMYSCDEWTPLSITPQNTTKDGLLSST
jgi:hypothetical protein